MTQISTPRTKLLAMTTVVATMTLFAPLAASAQTPSNDNFADRAVISSAPYVDAQDTGFATLEAGEPQSACGFDAVDSTVWYEYTPTLGGTVQIETIGSNFDTVVGVWTGDGLANLTEVACNDDAANEPQETHSVAAFSASAGTTYLIQVGGRDGQKGDLSFGLGSPTFGSISGTVTSDAAGALRRVCVDVFDAGTRLAHTQTTGSGAYSATGLPSGTYQLHLYDCDGRFDHLEEWYDDKPNQAEATSVVVASPNATPGIDAELSALRLSISKAGAGEGTVTSDPAGIDCGPDCEEIYEHGTNVVLTAAAGANSVLAGWTGCAVGGTNDCTVSMKAAKAVTATFNLVQRRLTVSKLGPGVGTVTGTGINCGPGAANDCQEDYDHGTSVTLTATADANSVLNGWSGCDVATGNECTVAMEAARDVAATFNLVQRHLIVTKTGPGIGVVTGTGIDCGTETRTDCEHDYDHGTAVKLKATSDPNSAFAGWTGCDVATGKDCTVNMTAAKSVTATFDTIPADTIITSGPQGVTSSDTAEFTFIGTKAGSTFECSLDAGAYSDCASPKSYSDLADGSHTFSVRATDPTGNIDETPAQRTWTVDTTPPQTLLASGPQGTTLEQEATFTFTSNESPSTFECSLDDEPYSECGSPKTYSDLAEGSHVFRVRATDAAGNVDETPAERTWTIDVTAPETSLTSGPSGTTASPQATFTFESNEPPPVTFDCSLDGAAFTNCKSPKTLAGLAEGEHTFRVRAVDSVGNTDPTPAERTWTVDFTGPETAITSGPSGITTSYQASFTFTSTESPQAFECALDMSGFAPCSSPKSYPGVGEGSHTFRVRAVDSVGNADPSPAERTWTVDAQGPNLSMQRPAGGLYVEDETVVGTGPASVVVGGVTVEVRAIDLESGVSAFKFEVDGTQVDPSKVTLAGNVYKFEFRPSTPGWHTISARATNGSGVQSALHVQIFGIPA